MEYTAVVIATPIASERIAKTVKSGVAPSRLRASLMSLTTRGSVASLVAQGHKWIHSDGPARGHECGGDSLLETAVNSTRNLRENSMNFSTLFSRRSRP